MAAFALVVAVVAGQAGAAPPVEVSPNPTACQPVTLTVTGPEASETGDPNPFLSYKFLVELWRPASPERGRLVSVGYFAADGNAGETGAASGNKWRARFRLSDPGTWRFRIHFAALTGEPAKESWEPIKPDGLEGELRVADLDPAAPGFYGNGGLTALPSLIRGRYLRVRGNPKRGGSEPFSPFLKAGVDSPENLLAYADFDGTRASGGPQPKREGESSRAGLHRYEPHVRDWKEGDPTWRGGKGKGLIGALNYLASQGVNSVYFLTMNVGGDGDDVWPWIDEKTRDRFDVSKLDQWGVVFDHAARLGIALHVVLTETENENLFEALDGPGDQKGFAFSETRALYYKELVARFGHHPAVFWNLGEENGGDGKGGEEFAKGNTTAQRKAFAAYLSIVDPNGSPVVVHTYPGHYDKVYEPLLGFDLIDGPSLQMGDPKQAHAETLKWLRKSRDAAWPWFVSVDEIGPADTGVVPDDAPDAAANHKLAREVLWGNLLAGGSGVEWYFDYKRHDNDLNCENFRSREGVWKFTKAAIDFLHAHVPLDQMEPADDLVMNCEGAFCLAKPGKVYVAYLPKATAPVEMKLPEGDAEYEVRWFDPIQGGELQSGDFDRAVGGDRSPIGSPPDPSHDWVVLLRKREP